MFKKGLMGLLALVMVFSFATVSQAAPWKDKNHKKFFVKHNWKPVTVTDVGSHWAKQPIQAMTSYGIILGYPDQTFRPNASVTNNEAIMMIARASGFEVSTTTSGNSSYGKFPAWMQDCIAYAVDEGIIEESELDGLNGNQAAKRYQVAVWATRAMGLEVDDQLAFEDADEIPFYARPYVGGMCTNRFMIGYPGNVFQPNKAVSRAELAMVLYRIMLAQDNDSNNDNTVNLRLETLNPKDGSYSVDPDTNKLTAKFNEDISAVDDLDDVMDGITVRNITDGEAVDIDEVSISGRTLTITLEDSLEQDKTYRVTISSGIIEAKDSGEDFAGLSGSKWQFTTSDEADVSELEIESLEPKDGSGSVDPDTNELTVKFNEDISAVEDLDEVMDGITVRNVTDGEDVDIDEVAISGRTLTITLEDSLEQGKTYRVIISSGIIEAKDSGANFAGITGSEWQFATEESFCIEELTPRDGATNVEVTDVLKAGFNGDISVVSGKNLLGAVRVYNKTGDVQVDLDKVEIDGDTLIITLEDLLEEDCTFEVTIKADYLENEDTGENFAGLAGSDWSFATE